MQQRGVAHHRRGDVGVEIERDADGSPWADLLAHGREQIALAVVDALGDHRAVQIQQDAVEPARRAQVCADPRLRVLVEVLGHASGGRRRRRERGKQHEPTRAGPVDHASEAGPGAPVDLEDLAAVTQLTRLELRAIGGERAEGVRLVRQHRHEDAHVASPGFAATTRTSTALV